MSKFDLNTRVATKYEVEDYPHYNVGTVVAHTDNGFHIVEYSYGSCKKVKQDDLLTEAEAKTLRATIDAEKIRLEQEFVEVRKQIQEKLWEATKLIEQSNKMATDHHQSLLDLYGETEQLVEVLSDIGWITSASC